MLRTRVVPAPGAGSGSVTNVTVAAANGFSGDVADGTTTPAITIKTSVTGLLKGNGTAVAAASAGTDYVAPGAITADGITMTTARLLGRTTASTGAVEEITVGSGLSLSGGALTATGGGSGTVTDVSVVSANGFAGSVATSTSTPAITLSTSITGLLKGNGTAISAAAAGTDYIVPGGAAGTPSSITLTNGTGLSLTTGVTGILPGANGGTGNGFFAISGPASTLKTYTVPNASCTLLTTNAVVTVAQGGIGVGTITGIMKGNGTSAVTAAVAGTDYVAPGGAGGTPSSITLTNATGYPTATASDVRTGTDTAKIVSSKTLYDASAPVALTPGTTVTPDFTAGLNFTLTPAQSFTLANPSAGMTPGRSGRIWITQDGTGSRVLSVGTQWVFMGGLKTLSTAAGTIDCINYFVVDSTHIRCELALAYS